VRSRTEPDRLANAREARVAIVAVFVQASPSRQGKGVGGRTSPPGSLPMVCAIVRVSCDDRGTLDRRFLTDPFGFVQATSIRCADPFYMRRSRCDEGVEGLYESCD